VLNQNIDNKNDNSTI